MFNFNQKFFELVNEHYVFLEKLFKQNALVKKIVILPKKGDGAPSRHKKISFPPAGRKKSQKVKAEMQISAFFNLNKNIKHFIILP